MPNRIFFLQTVSVQRRTNSSGRTPRVTKRPLRSSMCVTRPFECAIHAFVVSKSSLSWYTLPWMSATSVPCADDVMHEISGVFWIKR